MKASRGLSRNEALVLGALRREANAQTAYQLLEALRGEGLKAPLQVYRALRSLSERHLVHRLESRNAFVACSCSHRDGERTLIFAICDDCGRVNEFADAALDGRIAALTAGAGFDAQFAATEIRGRCTDCRLAGTTVPRP